MKHTDFQIKDNGKTLTYNSKTNMNYALLNDNLDNYKNKLVYFKLNCLIPENYARLGITLTEKAKNNDFIECA